ncbi:sensor histidine kinase [Peribacillus frigoritolerans]|uniref:HAMP domain-containing sensor histidine kinase n=1 Tax=Peribacillus frigoritolerans TaxID=450367 RepID=UPI00227F1818|nr:HAMP domain-containing sensor histidine kinase [Peribacillus frigoritolerans]MCY9138427.1 HAMP domain-containing histidine kinase [Peribacillus frigoritolerans]
MKTKKRTTLQRYWTKRYVLTLISGLILLSVFSLWWMEKTALEYRLSLLKYLADETSDRAIKENGQIVVGPILSEIVEEREKILHLNQQPIIYIVDPDATIIYTMPQLYIDPDENKLPDVIMKNTELVQKVKISDNKVYVVKSPITFNDETRGWVVIAQEEGALKEINQDHGLLAIMIGGLLILGTGVIYFLSRQISRPIQDVANAAVQVREGNYDIHFKEEEEIKEEEIYELIESFKEMTNRLKVMEKLRAELLAGVTHDLKTPVTSISGLIQAVKDDVVKGEQSKEFLDISLKETQRLQGMIEDLLNYNAISAGAFKIRVQKENINIFIKEIAYRWQVTQDDDQAFAFEIKVPDEPVFGQIDSLRMQQIVINLLNNARHALDGKGKIAIHLYEKDEERICIDVLDSGRGIPKHEQQYVFEPFYRGENKKLKVRGLGLGLPFSKMLAKAQKGDLVLKDSNEQGSIFTIVIEKADQI